MDNEGRVLVRLGPGKSVADLESLPGPDGKPHFTHGMAQELTIH